MPSLLQIVAHTPLWVWPLLLLVLALGWNGLRPRTVNPWRLALLPLVGMAASLMGVAQSAAPGLAMIGWAAGLSAALPFGHAIGRRREVRACGDGRLTIAGGAFLLLFGLSVFLARYALGVLFGVLPALARQPLWIAVSGAVGGSIAGIGVGWLSALLRNSRCFPELEAKDMLNNWIRHTLVGLVTLLALVVAAFSAVIAFDSPALLPRLLAADALPGFANWNMAEIPEVRKVTARDGAPLTYRLYPGARDRAVVLVHGSSAASISMHKVAQSLQTAGATVYSISLRGHGGSGTVNGDSSYRDQLDDDLIDFAKAVGLDDPKMHRTLVGFSSGGGFVLREAAGRNRASFDAYLAISPYIAYDSPTSRPAGGGWTSVAVPRAVALSFLDAVGLPWFQGLPVVRFATESLPSDSRTPVYSFRLLTGMQLGRDWRAEIARIDRPTTVMVGAEDELFYADRFPPLFAGLNPKITLAVLPGLGHLTMIADPGATAAIAAAWQRLAGENRVERYDFKVREDMFAGFDGDTEAFDRAMKQIEATLAANPDHAQALTWRGAARLFLAGAAFQRGAIEDGRALSQNGLADLDRGVALAPDTIPVHAARGPALLAYARGVRAFDRSQSDRLTAVAISDFDFIVAADAPRWGTLDEHDRGELLGALAAGWLQVGNDARAAAYLDRMVAELPGTPYARNAAVRRADPSAKTALTCLGCH